MVYVDSLFFACAFVLIIVFYRHRLLFRGWEDEGERIDQLKQFSGNFSGICIMQNNMVGELREDRKNMKEGKEKRRKIT